MKPGLCIFLLGIITMGYSQDTRLTTVEFVQVLDGHKEEALFYFQNNWKVLRVMAAKKGYIHSYQLMEVQASEDAPFDLMLVTTYLNEAQYKQREDHFTELIKDRGPLKLLNDLKPEKFRKSLFVKDQVRHWD